MADITSECPADFIGIRSQALGGHAIDCLETGEIERVRDLLNANAVI